MGASAAYDYPMARLARILLRDCARRALGVEHAALSRAWLSAAVREMGHCVLPEAVSVLIPARNEERVIAASITSLLASRGVEIEILVLDDASTDRTAEIVLGFAAQRSARAPGVFASAAGRLEWQAARLLCARGDGPLEYPLLSGRGCAPCSRSSCRVCPRFWFAPALIWSAAFPARRRRLLWSGCFCR